MGHRWDMHGTCTFVVVILRQSPFTNEIKSLTLHNNIPTMKAINSGQTWQDSLINALGAYLG